MEEHRKCADLIF